jgi:hypothetical protein
MESDPVAAARAAYRMGLIDAMLHEDNIEKVPGIFRGVLKGERKFRLRELQEAGAEGALEDWTI